MKMAIKSENNEFLVIILKHVNRLGTPNVWTIAHEKGHKMREQRIFGHYSQTCIGSYGSCESPGNPKRWEISHENGRNTQHDEGLGITRKLVNRFGPPKLWAISHENSHNTRK